MTQLELSALAGIVTSLLFSYVPGLREWFDPLIGDTKRLLQLSVAFVVAWAIFGLSCAEVLSTFTCDWPGILEVTRLIVAFLVANQTTYSLTPRSK